MIEATAPEHRGLPLCFQVVGDLEHVRFGRGANVRRPSPQNA